MAKKAFGTGLAAWADLGAETAAPIGLATINARMKSAWRRVGP